MAPARTEDEASFDTAIKEVPVTGQRTPFIQEDGNIVLSHTGEYY